MRFAHFGHSPLIHSEHKKAANELDGPASNALAWCQPFRILTYVFFYFFSRVASIFVGFLFTEKYPHVNESVHHHLWRVQYITIIYLVCYLLWIPCVLCFVSRLDVGFMFLFVFFFMYAVDIFPPIAKHMRK